MLGLFMDNISLAEFISQYEMGLVFDVVVVKDKIYGKSCKGEQGDMPYKIVFANIP